MEISILGSRREVVLEYSPCVFLSFCFVVVLAINMNLCGGENYIRSIWWCKCVLLLLNIWIDSDTLLLSFWFHSCWSIY